MFREMRRKGQQLNESESVAVLQRATAGVLALLGDEDYPYAVPISFVYEDSKIYFHAAVTGHKIDAIKRCDKASFCVIDQDQVMPEEYTTYFRSVIAFGKIHILENETEKRRAAEKLAVKYYPEDSDVNRNQMMDKVWSALCMLELRIEHMTGKAAKEIVIGK